MDCGISLDKKDCQDYQARLKFVNLNSVLGHSGFSFIKKICLHSSPIIHVVSNV